MAKALLRVSTNETHPYDDNDIIIIVEDGYIFGATELDTNIFKVVDIPSGKTAEELKYLVSSDLESPAKSMPPAFKRIPELMIQFLLNNGDSNSREITHQRRYQIDNDKIIDKRS